MKEHDELPQVQRAARREADRSREDVPGLGCLYGFLSLLVVITLNDVMSVHAARLEGRGLVREGQIVGFVPLFSVMAWLLVFHAPIGRRLRVGPVRAIRSTPAVVRHLLLWAALILAFALRQYAFPP